MATKRRMGPESSETRISLMDAVEALMQENGYAAVSARNVAKRANLKYQIIFYYFETMDDLLLATYRRRTQRVLDRTKEALTSSYPLHALWNISADPVDAALSLEYIAMSNHNQLIRRETIAFGEQLRRVVADDIRFDTPNFIDTPVDKFGLSLAISSLGAMLGFEAAMGLHGGHKETQELAMWLLNKIEPLPTDGVV